MLGAKSSLILAQYLDPDSSRFSDTKVLAAAIPGVNNWKSKFNRDLGPIEKLNLLVSNKAYVYLLLAAFFRFAGGYSLGYWAKSYFANVYPEYNN